MTVNDSKEGGDLLSVSGQSPDEIWASGLFEGEGCITTSQISIGNGRPRWRVIIAMKDEDVIRRFASVFEGLGNVTYVAKRDIWYWEAGAQKNVEKVLSVMLPWFGLSAPTHSESH